MNPFNFNVHTLPMFIPCSGGEIGRCEQSFFIYKQMVICAVFILFRPIAKLLRVRVRARGINGCVKSVSRVWELIKV